MIARPALLLIAMLLSFVWPGQATPPPFHIIIESGAPYYDPASPKIAAGAPIQWDNPTASPHTITHDGCITDESPCAFDSGTVPPNGTYTLPGLSPGRYPYQCRLHPIMRGMVVIVDAAGASSHT